MNGIELILPIMAMSAPTLIGVIAATVSAIIGIATILTFVWRKLLRSIKDEILTDLKAERAKEQAVYENDHKETTTVIEYLKDAILEAYKHDIRSIYYHLRDTGKLSDADKSYIDKISPIYFTLGGNSDIHAKVEAINAVYERRTQAAFDKAESAHNNTEVSKSLAELDKGINKVNSRKRTSNSKKTVE